MRRWGLDDASSHLEGRLARPSELAGPERFGGALTSPRIGRPSYPAGSLGRADSRAASSPQGQRCSPRPDTRRHGCTFAFRSTRSFRTRSERVRGAPCTSAMRTGSEPCTRRRLWRRLRRRSSRHRRPSSPKRSSNRPAPPHTGARRRSEGEPGRSNGRGTTRCRPAPPDRERCTRPPSGKPSQEDTPFSGSQPPWGDTREPSSIPPGESRSRPHSHNRRLHRNRV
jgi:hypothetical protein